MIDDGFLKRFREICEEVTGAPPPEDLSMATKVADLGMDSLGQLEMLTILEEETGQRMPDSALHGVTSVGDIRDRMAVPARAEEE